MSLTKRCAAEFIGTFWLVLGGCASAVLAAAFPNVGIGLLGVALAFGLGGIVGGKKVPGFRVASLHRGPGHRRHCRRQCPLRDCQRQGWVQRECRLCGKRLWG